jgi:hypothetical protein
MININSHLFSLSNSQKVRDSKKHHNYLTKNVLQLYNLRQWSAEWTQPDHQNFIQVTFAIQFALLKLILLSNSQNIRDRDFL